ncbi:MAG: DEAD/DEAH box helicase [bacterium]|nr:DEAD/DEAH box helicase [bacterium]
MYQKQNHYRFSRPSSHGGFGTSTRFSAGNQRRMKSLPNNPNLYIKRATPNLTMDEYTAKNSFTNFNLASIVKTNIVNKGYITPTPIQDQAIEPILEGRDLIGIANTGTGKTAAFLIPIINKIYEDKTQGALIVVPTRELALQILEEFRSLSANMNLSSVLVIGGANINRQVIEAKRSPHVIVATPGRLKDLIKRQAINLEDFSTIVLDEVDLMVDIGFINDVKYFISLLPKVRQSLFFSATISPKIQEVLKNFVTNPVTISVKAQDTAENIDQDVVRVSHPTEKVEKLHDLLIQDGFDKVLIFGRTKHGVEKLHKELDFRGFKVGAIHGNKTQGHRQRTLQSFKNNEIQILLATDVASRGLDIPDVTHVINYELPETFEDYIHRIGRTGRAGKTGVALTFV